VHLPHPERQAFVEGCSQRHFVNKATINTMIESAAFATSYHHLPQYGGDQFQPQFCFVWS